MKFFYFDIWKVIKDVLTFLVVIGSILIVILYEKGIISFDWLK